jgi:hypothetical protein
MGFRRIEFIENLSFEIYQSAVTTRTYINSTHHQRTFNEHKHHHEDYQRCHRCFRDCHSRRMRIAYKPVCETILSPDVQRCTLFSPLASGTPLTTLTVTMSH